MKKIIYILIIFVCFSCSDFQKALKSEEVSEKYQLATELFEKEKWSKSYRLLDQIIQEYRGKPQGEKVSYMHAMCSYKLENYATASYQFTTFTNLYPKSEKAEEAAFLAAKGYYFDAPIYSKDQKLTVEAIEKLQLFINDYPNSKYLTEANKLVKELDFKLEKKAYEIAKQYDLIKDYKASIKSFNNFLLDFPGTTLREDALFYRLDAAYKLAINSVDYLKVERAKEALKFYEVLVSSFKDTKYLKDATNMKDELNTIISTPNT